VIQLPGGIEFTAMDANESSISTVEALNCANISARHRHCDDSMLLFNGFGQVTLSLEASSAARLYHTHNKVQAF
jgi:hypothetical protein